MARAKKNVEPIVGPGKDPEDKLTVQKSTPLFSLWRSDMTLAEFKILDTYLSRINSREPEKRTVIFTKGELEQLLGVKKINKADLSARLNGLGRFVELEHADSKLHKVALFEEATGEMDENGQWTIKLTCTAKAMKYIFNIEKLGYLRYKLRCITSLTSRYAYVLFMYLESNRFRKSWIVDVDDLRRTLNCDNEESYKEFKIFNNRILRKCQKELLERTECRFTYESVKTGRRVTGVRFTLETLSDSIDPPTPQPPAIPGQLSLEDLGYPTEDDFYAPPLRTDPDDPLGIFIEVLPEELTREQVDALRTIAGKKVHVDPTSAWPWQATVADYLRHKTVLMKARGRDVQHPYNYLLSMIEKDPDVN